MTIIFITLTTFLKEEKEKKLTHTAKLSIPTAEASQIMMMLASLHRESLGSPSKCCAFVRLEAYSVTALALAKALWLGDMPKRHVGYALTLDGKITGLIL